LVGRRFAAAYSRNLDKAIPAFVAYIGVVNLEAISEPNR